MSISPFMSSYVTNPRRELVASLSVRQLLIYNIGPRFHVLTMRYMYSVFPVPSADTITIFLLINDPGKTFCPSPHPFSSVTYRAQNCFVYVVRFRLRRDGWDILACSPELFRDSHLPLARHIYLSCVSFAPLESCVRSHNLQYREDVNHIIDLSSRTYSPVTSLLNRSTISAKYEDEFVPGLAARV